MWKVVRGERERRELKTPWGMNYVVKGFISVDGSVPRLSFGDDMSITMVQRAWVCVLCLETECLP